MPGPSDTLPQILEAHQSEILTEWIAAQTEGGGARRLGGGSDPQLRQQAQEILAALGLALRGGGGSANVQTPAWAPVRDVLAGISRTRAQQGFTPSEIATFVLSLKRPLFVRIRQELSGNADALADTTWTATELIDRLALWTTEVFQKAREEVIARQQQDMLELSTPVVKLWEGVLALPMIGTLDSARTQIVMESLLQRIVETGSDVAILDITGVPTVDTLTAQHLLKTVTAARLMGAECIISGIRPQIAQTIVHLGVDLGDIVTKGTLADAFALALHRRGLTVARKAAPKAGA
ncbi:MAG TPA: STAS domain-containing protein [Gemmatimonadaceae bacterium]|nr:STAS domain-containing protein [Gemmatimonadaceae bacterium]